MAESRDQRAVKLRHSRLGNRCQEFPRRLIEKCDDDEILFRADSFAFNLIRALFPLLILGTGLCRLPALPVHAGPHGWHRHGFDCGDVRSGQPRNHETGSLGTPLRWRIIPRHSGIWRPARSSFSGSITNRWCLSRVLKSRRFLRCEKRVG